MTIEGDGDGINMFTIPDEPENSPEVSLAYEPKSPSKKMNILMT
jgi:hypothetical protein